MHYKTIIIWGLACSFIIAWGIFLTWKTFFIKGDTLYAGYTVFSDLSPHSALTSSFGRGGNIPAQYPHFASSGMRYHFFFYYLAGILHYLGMPLDWALNLPSLIGTWAFISLLTYIAVKWSKSLWSISLTILFMFFRSSLSGFYVLKEELQNSPSLITALENIARSMRYKGPLLRDDWGLYNLNVFANQRHLLWGMSILLILLIFFLPSLEEQTSENEFFSRASWKLEHGKSLFYALLLVLPLPYWHGSVTIALLLILGFWALFAKEKGMYLILGLGTLASAFVMQRAFQGNHLSLSNKLFRYGYYLEDTSPLSVLNFLITLFGPIFIFFIIIPLFTKSRQERIVSLSFLLPIVFAFTISLTPDITVNHKFFMMTGLLYIPLISKALIQFIDFGQRQRFKSLRITLVSIYIILHIFTGITDTFAYNNQSSLLLETALHDSFSQWIETHSDVDDVALTPPWAMHTYFLTGRHSFYGHAYYAGSAGYDTVTRDEKIFEFLAQVDISESETLRFVEENNLRYLMIDDNFRSHESYFINEEKLAEYFRQIAFFAEQDNLTVYDLSSMK